MSSQEESEPLDEGVKMDLDTQAAKEFTSKDQNAPQQADNSEAVPNLRTIATLLERTAKDMREFVKKGAERELKPAALHAQPFSKDIEIKLPSDCYQRVLHALEHDRANATDELDTMLRFVFDLARAGLIARTSEVPLKKFIVNLRREISRPGSDIKMVERFPQHLKSALDSEGVTDTVTGDKIEQQQSPLGPYRYLTSNIESLFKGDLASMSTEETEESQAICTAVSELPTKIAEEVKLRHLDRNNFREWLFSQESFHQERGTLKDLEEHERISVAAIQAVINHWVTTLQDRLAKLAPSFQNEYTREFVTKHHGTEIAEMAVLQFHLCWRWHSPA